MTKTVAAVTTAGLDPAFLNVERDEQFPERLRITLRGDKPEDGIASMALGTFTKEEFALFLVRVGQQL